MSYKSLNDSVLILPDKPKEMTKSGLILPKDFHETIQSGVVKSVREYRFEFGQRIPAEVAAGDRVFYPKSQILAKIDTEEGEMVVVRHSGLLVEMVTPPVPPIAISSDEIGVA